MTSILELESIAIHEDRMQHFFFGDKSPSGLLLDAFEEIFSTGIQTSYICVN